MVFVCYGDLAINYAPSSLDDKDKHRVNRAINTSKMLVIDNHGNSLGVLLREQALARAAEVSLDLVEVSPNSDPPVCRIMNYGKFKYEEKKKKAEAKKHQKIVNIKEIKLTPNIGEHDYQVKLASLLRFINDGDKVKVTLRFKGRELAHKELGEKVILRLAQDCEETAKQESVIKMEGKQMTVSFVPLKG